MFPAPDVGSSAIGDFVMTWYNLRSNDKDAPDLHPKVEWLIAV